MQLTSEKLRRTWPKSTVKRLRLPQQIMYLQTLGELLKSGYSLTYAVRIMASHPNDLQHALKYVDQALQEGKPFYEAVAPFLKQSLVVQIQLAEQHGDLPATLMHLGDRLVVLHRQLQKIQQIMIYPLFLLVLLIGMLVGLRVFLLPIIAQWGTGITQASESLAWTRYAWLVVGSMVIGTGIWLARFSRAGPLKRLEMLVKLPLVGSLIKTLINYQVSQQLGLLLQAGLSLPAILNALANLPQDSVERAFAQSLGRHLRQGNDLFDFVLTSPILDPTLATYFERGKPSREVGTYLEYFAKQQFDRLMLQADRLIGLVQPVVFAVIGIAIMVLYLTMLLPMYEMIGQVYQ
jgi:competence protein ComGB